MESERRNVGQAAIDRLSALLADKEAVRLGRVERSLSIVPREANTFVVAVSDDGEEATVHACGWHEHFDDEEQAVWCAMGLLSPYYRVVKHYVGSALVNSSIERYQAEGWVQIGMTMGPIGMGGLLQRLARKPKRQVVYQQNALMPTAPWKDMFPGVDLDEQGLPPGSIQGFRETTC